MADATWKKLAYEVDVLGLAVQAGAITDSVTKAPTHDAVFDALAGKVPVGAISIFVASSTATAAEKALATPTYTCDGTADDVQINAALAVGSNTVQMSNGGFNLANSITVLKENQVLRGQGWNTILRPVANLTQMIQLGGDVSDALVQGATLKDFQIRGESASWAVTHAIYGKGLSRPLIENVMVYDVTGNGITIDSDGTYLTYVARIINNYISTIGGTGLYLKRTAGTHEGDIVKGNNIEHCVHEAIECESAYATLSDSIINGCCTTPASSHGASIRLAAPKISITGGSIIASYASAVRVDNGGCVDIIGVHFTDCSLVATNTYDWFNIANANPEGVAISGCTFRAESANLARYFVLNRNSPRVTINGNTISTGIYVTGFQAPSGTTDPIAGLPSDGVSDVIQGNVGYIHNGELRTASGALTAGNANAFAIAWNNPEAQPIWAQLMVEITTAGGTAGALLDAGSGASATTASDNLIDGADLNATNLLVSSAWVKLDANGGATDWITGQILVANAASLAGKFYVKYMGV
jgi:hypothetical protein